MEPGFFDNILQDNFSGSGKILFRVQETLLSLPSGKPVGVSALQKQLSRLESRFPHFAVLFHFTGALKTFLTRHPSPTGSTLAQFTEQYRARWEKAQAAAAENFLQSIPLSGKSILLHSNSSALHTLFGMLAHRKIRPVVWQTVSSPVNEGVLQAGFLQKSGFQVNVLHEDAVSRFVEQIDMALFGADMVWDTGFLNKAGTFPLALVFRHFGKPVYVLAESRKVIDRQKIGAHRFRRFLQENPKPAEELAPGAPGGVSVHNFYFEAVPLELTNRVFTEKG